MIFNGWKKIGKHIMVAVHDPPSERGGRWNSHLGSVFFEKSLVILIFIFYVFKLFLALRATPFGVHQDARHVWWGAVNMGYKRYDLGFYEETEFFIAYVTSVLLRLGFPGEFMLFFNIFCNIITSVLVFFLVETIFDRRTGLIASSLVALNCFLTFYSFTIGYPDTVLTMFATCTLLLLWLRVGKRRHRHAMWFAATAFGLAMLTKFSGLALVGVMFSFLCLFRKEISKWDLFAFFAVLALVFMSVPAMQARRYLAYAFYCIQVRLPSSSMIEIVGRLLFASKRYLLSIPYQVSIIGSLFALFGMSSLVVKFHKGGMFLMAWMVSFFLFHIVTISTGGRMMDYYCCQLACSNLDYGRSRFKQTHSIKRILCSHASCILGDSLRLC